VLTLESLPTEYLSSMTPIEILSSAASRVASSTEAAKVSIEPWEVLSSVAEMLEQLDVFRHPLGFFHFEITPLLDASSLSRIRLHVWSETSLSWQDDLGLIHDHTWELRSVVLIGGLTDVILEARASPQGDLVGSQVRYSDAGTAVTKIDGRFDVRELGRRPVMPLHAYHLRAGSLHRSEVFDLPTATLVVAQETGRDSALVFGPEMPAMLGTPKRVPAGHSEAAQALQETLTAIERAN
jgi:hypothetical protein